MPKNFNVQLKFRVKIRIFFIIPPLYVPYSPIQPTNFKAHLVWWDHLFNIRSTSSRIKIWIKKSHFPAPLCFFYPSAFILPLNFQFSLYILPLSFLFLIFASKFEPFSHFLLELFFLHIHVQYTPKLQVTLYTGISWKFPHNPALAGDDSKILYKFNSRYHNNLSRQGIVR